MYEELLDGYRIDPHELVNEALFDEKYDEMVVVRDIEYYSLCEHHLLPFLGRAHVAYFPSQSRRGALEDPAHRRYVCPQASSSGTHDAPDCRVHPDLARSLRCGSCDRGPAPMRHDARRQETRSAYDHVCHAGRLPRQHCDARRVPFRTSAASARCYKQAWTRRAG